MKERQFGENKLYNKYRRVVDNMASDNRKKARDVAKEIIFFVLVTVLAYVYFFVVLLVISFVTISFIPFTIERIFIISLIGMVVVDVFYVMKRIKKNKERI